MSKREFVLLAHTYDVKKHSDISGWMLSEKLDGCRAFWDGGITRGKLCSEVAFANTEKDSRYLHQPRATGLWSRYGKAIQCPDWFLDSLPPTPLDGELYAGRGGFQQLISTVKQLNPGPEWKNVTYQAFDIVPLRVIFSNGEINNTNFKKTFNGISTSQGYMMAQTVMGFRDVCIHMRKMEQNSVFKVHTQIELPYNPSKALNKLDEALEAVISVGGEGVMLRHPMSLWAPQRSHQLLKVKPMLDSEAIVIGYVWGRETTLGSKLLGSMGALIVTWHGHQFELSGFTDAERTMMRDGAWAYSIGAANPGRVVDRDVENPMFPRGSKVTFRYRELTDKGIPKEARYWRKFGDQ